jgi:hypothetical protein
MYAAPPLRPTPMYETASLERYNFVENSYIMCYSLVLIIICVERKKYKIFSNMKYTFKFYEFLDFIQKKGIKMVCIAIFTYFVIQCIGRYSAKRTGTGAHYTSISETPFPEFSFCVKDRYKLANLKAKNDYVYSWNWNTLDGSNRTPGEYYRY